LRQHKDIYSQATLKEEKQRKRRSWRPITLVG
jgi:hypothetical protein